MKTALLITTYNRPEYLKRCIASLVGAISAIDIIVISDDCSDDQYTIDILSSIKQDNSFKVIGFNKNQGIKKSLIHGYENCFMNGADLVINLDSDAIVAPNCFTELIRLKTKYPDRIITGFHSTTKNKDGSERHIILDTWEDVYVKKSVGGINMIVNRQDYEQYVKPSLLTNLNWDHQTSIRAEKDGKPVLSVKRSLVQHIGLVSAMGHSHDVPDVAEGFSMLNLANVTLCGADSRDPHSLNHATRISQQNIEYGAVKLFTDRPMYSKSDYSLFIMRELYKHIETSHMLIIQADGFVLNAESWKDEWLQYDYIGASWCYTDGIGSVGNGGFSLRSKRLMEIVATDKNIIPLASPHNEILEDHCICRIYRKYLEDEYRIKFAPVEVADRFSIEAYGRTMRGANKYSGQFGFHSFDVDFSEKEGYKPYALGKRRWKLINYDV